jgi:hypothetical protein
MWRACFQNSEHLDNAICKDGGIGLEGGNQHSRLVVKTVNTEMIDSMASRWSLFSQGSTPIQLPEKLQS